MKNGFFSLSLQQQNGVKARPDKRNSRRELKYAIKAVGNLDQIFDMISQAFDICPEIRSILILFGTTPISPKESYLLTMPALHPEFDSLSVKNSVKTLFRQIITQDVLGGAKSMSPTNMIVMVNAPKNSGIAWFLPKPTFKLPVRGRRHVFNLSCKQPQPADHSIVCSDGRAEISGIEPLESSAIDEFSTRLSLSGDEESEQNSTRSLLESFEISQSASAISTLSSSSRLSSSDVTVIDEKSKPNSPSSDVGIQSGARGDEDITVDSTRPSMCTHVNEHVIEDILSSYVWFQAPVFVKGYKDKSSKTSIFM